MTKMNEPLAASEAPASYQVVLDSLRVRPGYKKTEVGVIPEEWKVARIGDLGSVVRGGSPRPAGDPRYFNGSFIPWLTVAALTNISENQIRVSETVGFLTEEGSNHSRTLGRGTLIIANSGATLGVAKLLGVTCCANDGIAAIINQRVGDKGFVCHYINTRTKHLREVVATGNGQPNLNTSLIRGIPIPFPPLPEQRAIAAALSDVDALIASLDKLIAKKRDIKQAAMQNLLTGKQRLPGFSGKWEVKRLGDVADIDPDNLSNVTSADYTFNYISLEDVDLGSLRSYSEQIFHFAPSRARRRLRSGDILVSTVRPNLQSHLLFASAEPNWICSTGFSVVRCRTQDAAPAYMFFHFFGHLVTKQIEALLTGSNYPAINGRDVKALEIPMPKLSEQTAIAAMLSDMDAEIAALEARCDKTRLLKQGMMQELLTGKIRLIHDKSNVLQISVYDKTKKETNKGAHNWAFHEAVVISAIASKFGSKQYPLGRMRYTKLAYLMHRHLQEPIIGYLKKAAGPYNPATRYKGPEKIAIKNGYIERAVSGDYNGSIAGKNIRQALDYFTKWGGDEALIWLEQFRYEKNDSLELITTVDKAILELRDNGKMVNVDGVKNILRADPEWLPKLEKDIFSDANIEEAICRCQVLFDGDLK